MKKVFILFTSLMIAFLSISCSSVPKKAAADKPLVIGVMSIYFPEKDSYQGDFDTAVKGAVKNNIEVSVEDVKTKKVYTTNTNPDGLYVFTNLNANSIYRITKISFQKSGVYGTVTRWINFPNADSFTPQYNSVLNLGEMKFIWQDNKVINQFLGNVMVKNYFTKEAADSEWLTKPIINQFQSFID